jgi:predicted TIM-barrel fold metal-dependent hydrolase
MCYNADRITLTFPYSGDVMIIDFHTHITPPHIIQNRDKYLTRDIWFEELYGHPQARLVTADELIAEMDRSGVQKSVTFGFGWRDAGLLREANDYVIDAVRRYPDRLIGFGIVNPACSEAAVQELERCAAHGLRGVGELMPNGQGFSLDDERAMRPVVEVAVAHGMPILSHTSEPVGHFYPGKGTVNPDVVYRFVELFPDATLVCAHWGGGLPFYELMPEVMRRLRKVYYDTAASLFLYRDKIFFLAGTLMPEKILFATDYPLIGQRKMHARLVLAGLPRATLNKIQGGNAARLLGLKR